MGKVYDVITSDLAGWISRQRVFFVATAPRAEDGLVNCSPKGMDTFSGPGTAGSGLSGSHRQRC